MDWMQLIQQNTLYVIGFILFIWLIKTPILARIYGLEYISVEEAFDIFKQKSLKPLFLDIRTQWELDNDPRIKKSKFIPLSELSDHMDELKKQGGMEKKVIIVCRTGGRSKVAGVKLKRAGFTDVAIMRGGIMSWHRASYPVTIPKPKRSYG